MRNSSNRVLTQADERVLMCGLNFAVSPTHIPVVELITATESAIHCNNIPEEEAELLQLRVSSTLSNAKVPPANLEEEERMALKSLSTDQNIIVLQLTKATVQWCLIFKIMIRKWRQFLVITLRMESCGGIQLAYSRPKPLECLKTLKREKVIDNMLYYRLYIPLRPVVSSNNTVTYNIA